jgi:hypothetical protein
MFIFPAHAAAAILIPALVVPSARLDCELDPRHHSADDRAVARFTAATHDYVAYGKHEAIFHDDAAAMFRFHLRVSRWLHRYDASETIGESATYRGALIAPDTITAVLPELPEELAYRLSGPHLLLIDRRTHAVVDLLPDALADGG